MPRLPPARLRTDPGGSREHSRAGRRVRRGRPLPWRWPKFERNFESSRAGRCRVTPCHAVPRRAGPRRALVVSGPAAGGGSAKRAALPHGTHNTGHGPASRQSPGQDVAKPWPSPGQALAKPQVPAIDDHDWLAASCERFSVAAGGWWRRLATAGHAGIRKQSSIIGSDRRGVESA